MSAKNKECPSHRCTLHEGYIHRAAEAELRMARGDYQRKCPTCGRWIFASDYITPTPEDAHDGR